MDRVLVGADQLSSLVEQKLKVYIKDEEVRSSVTSALMWASLRGIDSHGIRLLPHYCDAVTFGRILPENKIDIKPVHKKSAIVVDANHNFAHHAISECVETLVSIASESGVAFGAVKNSNHCGALGYYGNIAANHGMIALGFTNASPRLMTPNGLRPFFGNNPMCFCAPFKNNENFIYDAATTTTTFNAIKLAKTNGSLLPAGVAANQAGELTTDPQEATQLIGIGGYKGFGLAMVAEILCTLLTGMPSGNLVSKMYDGDLSDFRYLGQSFIVIDLKSVIAEGDFKAALNDLIERLKCEPPAGEATIHYPGEREFLIFEERRSKGIPISDELLSFLNG